MDQESPKELLARLLAGGNKSTGFRTIIAEIVETTAGQVRSVCSISPDHSLIPVLTKAVENYPDEQVVYLEKSTLQALQDGGRVVEVQVPGEKDPTFRKEVELPEGGE